MAATRQPHVVFVGSHDACHAGAGVILGHATFASSHALQEIIAWSGELQPESLVIYAALPFVRFWRIGSLGHVRFGKANLANVCLHSGHCVWGFF